MRNTHTDKINKIELLCIRHGKTKGNLEKRYIGLTDESLLEEEKQRLPDYGYEAPQLLFVSSRKRARQTAQILFPGMEQIILPDLDEMNFGDFEGKNYQELQTNPVYQQYIDSGGSTPFPHGESRDEFADRMEKAFDEILRFAEKEKKTRVVVVAHGGSFMAILWRKLGGDYFSYYVGNGDCLKVQVSIRKDNGEKTWNIIS